MKSKMFKLLLFIHRGDKSIFDISKQKQEEYLNILGDPSDDIDRSHKQYLCQFLFISNFKKHFLNIVSIPCLPFLLVLLRLKRSPFFNRHEHIDAIGEFQGLEEVIPKEVSASFNVNNDKWFEGSCLSDMDICFIMKIFFRHPKHLFFFMKCMIKIAKYSYMISKYQPRALLVHNEYSFTSSILTCYCNYRNVLHINIMHGEKLYFIRDAFFRYDRCYVWHKHYSDLFISMKASMSQFEIALPSSMCINCDELYNATHYVEYKYYLAEYTKKELLSIIHSMNIIIQKGVIVHYRPHPRYSDISLLEQYVDRNLIEYPDHISIQASIANTSYVIGSYTTVLLQAYTSGKEIILDDVTYKKQYNKLRELEYLLISQPHKQLSTLKI
jgi:hypothetical protein